MNHDPSLGLSDKLLRHVQTRLRTSEPGDIVALTGAGISASAGIAPYRGPGGVLRTALTENFLTDQSVREKFWASVPAILAAQPTRAHEILAQHGVSIITQNVDTLHFAAGSASRAPDVIPLHGHLVYVVDLDGNHPITMNTFLDWRERHPDKELLSPDGLIYRPAVTFFGEIPLRANIDRAQREIQNAKIMLVIGTSLLVSPANMLLIAAAEAGVMRIMINPEVTALNSIFDVVIKEDADFALPILFGDNNHDNIRYLHRTQHELERS